jgi:hypothetical protein
MICKPCSEELHEKCVTRDVHSQETKCKCGCVGNPFVGIVCLTPNVKKTGGVPYAE